MLVLGMAEVVRGASRSDFEWMRPIHGPLSVGRIYSLEIPPDVFARSRQFPDDLRIMDESDQQWPFFLEALPSRTVIRNLDAVISNQAWIEGPDKYLRIDFNVSPASSESPRPRHNQVQLETSGHDFIRRVEVFGSENQSTWALLGRGYLLRVEHPRRMVEEVIQYAWSDYPFVHVKIYPHARNALESFTLHQATLQAVTGNEPVNRPVAHQRREPAKTDKNPEAQVWVLDLAYEKMPVRSLRLVAAGGDYVRRVVVSARDREEETWRFAGAGDIHRIGTSSKDEVPLNGSGRFLKCEVYHYDDPPLEPDVIEVLAAPRRLILEPATDRPAALLYGGLYVEAPRYDLESRTGMEASSNGLPAALGEPVRNPFYRKTGYGPWGPWLAGIAVGLASVVVLWVVVRMFKRMSS
jgi:hypothetical protein